MLSLLRDLPGAVVHWVVFSAGGERETRPAAAPKRFSMTPVRRTCGSAVSRRIPAVRSGGRQGVLRGAEGNVPPT